MKRTLLLGLISIGAAANVLAQGTVIFENSAGSGGGIFISDGHGGFFAAPPGNYTMAFLWAPGSSTGVAQSSFAQIGTYAVTIPIGSTGASLFFTDAQTLTTGAATAGGSVAVFEVEGWTGSYANYAAAIAGGAYVGQTAQFLNGTGNPTPPATPPVSSTGWDGNLLLVPAPEPGTIALLGLGGAGIWLFRRRKIAK